MRWKPLQLKFATETVSGRAQLKSFSEVDGISVSEGDFSSRVYGAVLRCRQGLAGGATLAHAAIPLSDLGRRQGPITSTGQ
jgi:hypothetical protein